MAGQHQWKKGTWLVRLAQAEAHGAIPAPSQGVRFFLDDEIYEVISRTSGMLRIGLRGNRKTDSNEVIRASEVESKFMRYDDYLENLHQADLLAQAADRERYTRLTVGMSEDDRRFISRYCQPTG